MTPQYEKQWHGGGIFGGNDFSYLSLLSGLQVANYRRPDFLQNAISADGAFYLGGYSQLLRRHPCTTTDAFIMDAA